MTNHMISEYKSRPYRYIPCLSEAHSIDTVILRIQSDIPKSNFTTFFVTFHQYHKHHMATCFDQCWSFSSLFKVRYSLFWDLIQSILVVTDVSLWSICPISKDQAVVFDPWRRDGYFVPKRRYLTTNLRNVTSLKSKGLIYTAAEDGNLLQITSSNYIISVTPGIGFEMRTTGRNT